MLWRVAGPPILFDPSQACEAYASNPSRGRLVACLVLGSGGWALVTFSARGPGRGEKRVWGVGRGAAGRPTFFHLDGLRQLWSLRHQPARSSHSNHFPTGKRDYPVNMFPFSYPIAFYSRILSLGTLWEGGLGRAGRRERDRGPTRLSGSVGPRAPAPKGNLPRGRWGWDAAEACPRRPGRRRLLPLPVGAHSSH